MHGGAERYRFGSGNVCRGRRRGVPGLGHTAVFIQGAEERGADPQALGQARFGASLVQKGVVGVGLGGQAPACRHHHFCLSKCHPQTLP